jgi:hypothetical protein
VDSDADGESGECDLDVTRNSAGHEDPGEDAPGFPHTW